MILYPRLLFPNFFKLKNEVSEFFAPHAAVRKKNCQCARLLVCFHLNNWSILCLFILPAFGSCTCTAANLLAADGSSNGAYNCTCDETEDCASSPVTHGGKSVALLISIILPINRSPTRSRESSKSDVWVVRWGVSSDQTFR